MKANTKNGIRKGFTLIELIIVVAILGIIAAMAAPYVGDFMYRARTTGVDANLKTLSDCEARLQIIQAKNGIEE